MISWEKTVEWAFVKSYFADVDFAVPIDGIAEISDAMLTKYGRWFLIEFKHVSGGFSSEAAKYPLTDKMRTLFLLRSRFGMTRDEQKRDPLLNGDDYWRRALAVEGRKNTMDQILSDAEHAFKNLKDSYGSLTSDSVSPIEPHFFVYSRDNTFDKLWALPYWVDWDQPIPNARKWPEFDADSIALLGSDFSAFDDYVLELAIARGYDIKKFCGAGAGAGAGDKPAEEADGDNALDRGGIVCGYAAGLTAKHGVAMSLRNFLASRSDLKATFSAKVQKGYSSTPGSKP